MNIKIIIGVGTGRCGTTSLAKIISLQPKHLITHESEPHLPWNFDESMIQQKISYLQKYDAEVVGDAGFYYLPYLEYLIERYNNIKVIGLKREKQKVIKSYLKKTKGRNHWMEHDGSKWRLDEWYDKYPKYQAKTKKEALSRYWEEYYDILETIKRKYPSNILVMDMNYALNDLEGINKILSFIGVEETKRVLVENTKENILLDQG